MRPAVRVALAIGFFAGLGVQVALAGGFGVGSGGLQGGSTGGTVGAGSSLGSGCVATETGINCVGIDAGAINVQGAVTVGGLLTVVTPSDITVGISSDINLGNSATSAVRGGSGLLRLDDAIGARLFYTGSTLTLDGNASLTNTAGRFSVSGDTTSPALAAFRLVPQDAEPSGASLVGDLYMTSSGVLRVCVTAGTPCASWVNVGAQ